MIAVSESGFYKLIARSRKASTEGSAAFRFSEWVFGEVTRTKTHTRDIKQLAQLDQIAGELFNSLLFI